jgi:hypothetical protein
MNSLLSYSLILFILVQSVSTAFAGSLILSESQLIESAKRYRENQYRLRRGPIYVDVFSFELGKAVTPFFLASDQETIQRRFKNENQCFEVSFFSKVNLARKIHCSNLISDLKLPEYPEYQAVRLSDILKKGSMHDFVFQNTESHFLLKAYLHTFGSIEMDKRILRLKDSSEFPTQDFPLSIIHQGKVEIAEKSGLKIRQDHTLSVGKIGIQDARIRQLSNEVNISPSDLVFHDQKGSLIVLNQLLLPNVFRKHLLIQTSDSLSYFNELQSRSRKEAICYRDDWLEPSQLDCQKVLLDQVKTAVLRSYRWLKIDFTKFSVEAF